ncbi:MAG: DUF433 domain-containing protein [Desulfovibrio sp.]|nr:DUF433 domain-containing protein [Desulfovibrio sp.]
MEGLERITQTPGVMGGKPCIRGMRVTVGTLVGQIAGGRSIDGLLDEYPSLEREDIVQALRYAAWRSDEGEQLQGVCENTSLNLRQTTHASPRRHVLDALEGSMAEHDALYRELAQ